MVTRREYIFDSCVLIDYLDADSSVLARFSKHIGRAHVILDQLAEVDGLDGSRCGRLGLLIEEPTTEQLQEAGGRPSYLSFWDHLCLVVARDKGWTCVTNDKGMHRACKAIDVHTIWGLEVLIELVQVGQLTTKDALVVAGKIAEDNARITSEVLADLRLRLEKKIDVDRKVGRGSSREESRKQKPEAPVTWSP
jgi:hypothetical protein